MGSVRAILSPAELNALKTENLTDATCVVFDVLRATSTMLAALAQGAHEIIPVSEIAEALAVRRERPEVLLAGERCGLRITREITGGVDFDFGNSPREFTRERVAGRTIAMTTTNGTRALSVTHRAARVLIGGLVNLECLASYLLREPPASLLLVGSGTADRVALEDALAAAALWNRLKDAYDAEDADDSIRVLEGLWEHAETRLDAVFRTAQNARRLLAIPELAADVPWCLAVNSVSCLGGMTTEGTIRTIRTL